MYVSIQLDFVKCMCLYNSWILWSFVVKHQYLYQEVVFKHIPPLQASTVSLWCRDTVIRRHFSVGSDTVQWGCKFFVWGKLPSDLKFSKSNYTLKQTFRLNRLNIFKTSPGISEYLTDFKGQLKLYKKMKHKKIVSFSTFILSVRKGKVNSFKTL